MAAGAMPAIWISEFIILQSLRFQHASCYNDFSCHLGFLVCLSRESLRPNLLTKCPNSAVILAEPIPHPQVGLGPATITISGIETVAPTLEVGQGGLNFGNGITLTPTVDWGAGRTTDIGGIPAMTFGGGFGGS